MVITVYGFFFGGGLVVLYFLHMLIKNNKWNKDIPIEDFVHHLSVKCHQSRLDWHPWCHTDCFCYNVASFGQFEVQALFQHASGYLQARLRKQGSSFSTAKPITERQKGVLNHGWRLLKRVSLLGVPRGLWPNEITFPTCLHTHCQADPNSWTLELMPSQTDCWPSMKRDVCLSSMHHALFLCARPTGMKATSEKLK